MFSLGICRILELVLCWPTSWNTRRKDPSNSLVEYLRLQSKSMERWKRKLKQSFMLQKIPKIKNWTTFNFTNGSQASPNHIRWKYENTLNVCKSPAAITIIHLYDKTCLIKWRLCKSYTRKSTEDTELVDGDIRSINYLNRVMQNIDLPIKLCDVLEETKRDVIIVNVPVIPCDHYYNV